MTNEYVRFTKDMVPDYTILVPQMLPIHFGILLPILENRGYTMKILDYKTNDVLPQGLRYVHNDMCYPALLVIGQFVTALQSGEYDPDKTAVLLTQTGGGCRASNYIPMLRHSLADAGFPQVPVIGLNAGNVDSETQDGLTFDLKLIREALAALYYGDMLMALSNRFKPYELNKGETAALTEKWSKEVARRIAKEKKYKTGDMRRTFNEIADDFAKIKISDEKKVKVGIVGEIYVKYSPVGNNRLEAFLESEDCEVCVPGLMGFMQYCFSGNIYRNQLYGGEAKGSMINKVILKYLSTVEGYMKKACERIGVRIVGLYSDTVKMNEGLISHGCNMGEGWLLTAEMAELIEEGYPNIICAQPFGCLPNHIVGKGMISKLRRKYPEANITPIDYDPGATAVNQENRIKLMIAVAKERMGEAHQAVRVTIPKNVKGVAGSGGNMTT